MSDSPLRGSDVFASPPSPPNQRSRDRINHTYDAIIDSLDELEKQMESSFSQLRARLDDTRSAVEQRRSLVIRGLARDDDYQLTIAPFQGIFRWKWYTDGSSGRLPDGDQLRFAIGCYFGADCPANFGRPASAACSSMFEGKKCKLCNLPHKYPVSAELEAIQQAFRAASTLGEHGEVICKDVTIVTDNLEVKEQLVAVILERDGATALEGLLANSERVRVMLTEIRNEISRYNSVQIEWIRSHTGGMSSDCRGNEHADKLAKQGLSQAFEDIQDLV